MVVAVLLLYAFVLIPPVKNSLLVATSPVVRFTRMKLEGVSAAFSVLTAIPELARENGALRNEVSELSAVAIRNKELEHENNLLRQELSLKPSQNSKLIAAQVISRTSSVGQESLLVNRGSNDGFFDGMVVISQGYLIGRVTEILPQSSRVTLITSPESLLPVVLQESRSVGLLKGGPEGLLITEVPRDVVMKPDEAIVTSNIGDVVMNGIPIGKVATVLSASSDVFQSARLTSPIDFYRLELVFGMKQ